MPEKKENNNSEKKQATPPQDRGGKEAPASGEPLAPQNDPFMPKKSAGSSKGKIKLAATPPKEQEKKKPRVQEPHVDIEKEATLKYGKIIGAYEILKPLSLSGTGEIYLVQQRMTGKKYSLRLMPLLLPEIDPDFPARFESEALKIKRLSHRNIVSLYAYGTERNYYYLITDYIENSGKKALSLSDRLEKTGKLPEFQIKKIAQILCNALDYAHNCEGNPVTHSDLKPSNILYDKNNHMWLSGFSNINMVGKQYFINIIKHVLNENFRPANAENSEISNLSGKFAETRRTDRTASIVLLQIKRKLKFMDLDITVERVKDLVKNLNPFKKDRQKTTPAPEEKNLLSFKSVIETYDYMSPEQKAGEDPSPQSNVYSVGLILYHMLTGKRVPGTWDFPSKYGCGKGWDPIILRCLQMEPEDRYQSISALYGDIKSVNEKRSLFYPLFIGVLAIVLLTAVFLIFSSIQYDMSSFLTDTPALTEKENRPKNIRKISSAQRIPFRVKMQPPGASLTFFRDKKFVARTEANEAGAAEVLLSEGPYTVELKKEGYESSIHEISITPDNTEAKFNLYPLQSQKETRTYTYLDGLKNPKQGHPWIVPGLKLELLPVEPGSFLIGSPLNDPERDAEEIAMQSVTLSYYFWMAKFEVNQNEYDEIMWNNPSLYSRAGSKAPVERIAWHNAMEFCKKLTVREKTAGRLPENYVYRLPTEAEWEYCCRAGSDSIYPFGSNKDHLVEHAWIEGNSEKSTHPAGEKNPNAWGFYDMLGNVGEWCLDAFGESILPSIIRMESEKPSGSYYVIRGGSWENNPDKVRCASRFKTDYPFLKRSTTGFRVVLAPLQVPDVKNQE